VIGASVLVRKTAASPSSWRQRTEWATITTSSGVFQVDGLPNGEYTLCVQAPSTTWLNPCEWSATRLTVAVSAGQRAVNKAIILKRAAVVSIRVDDPGKLLSQNEGKVQGAHLLIGVRSDKSVFHAASVTANGSAGRSYAVKIPFDAKVDLVVASSFFRINDAAGLPLSINGAAATLLVPSGQTLPALRARRWNNRRRPSRCR